MHAPHGLHSTDGSRTLNVGLKLYLPARLFVTAQGVRIRKVGRSLFAMGLIKSDFWCNAPRLSSWLKSAIGRFCLGVFGFIAGLPLAPLVELIHRPVTPPC